MNPDFSDILSALSGEKAEFLIVGVYAMAAHGLPRATGDLDVWVGTTGDNPQRVWRALQRFGATLEKVTLEDLTSENLIFQIGIAPVRIDILTSIDGVDFPTAWRERIEAQVEGMKVPVISRDLLARNKRASGRPQDVADLAWLMGKTKG